MLSLAALLPRESHHSDARQWPNSNRLCTSNTASVTLTLILSLFGSGGVAVVAVLVLIAASVGAVAITMCLRNNVFFRIWVGAKIVALEYSLRVIQRWQQWKYKDNFVHFDNA